jgi:hypothetical protein
MNSITIPPNLIPTFTGTEPTRVCDESGRLLGFFTPFQEGTEADYEWAFANITKEQIQESLQSGMGRPLAEALAELRQQYGP